MNNLNQRAMAMQGPTHIHGRGRGRGRGRHLQGRGRGRHRLIRPNPNTGLRQYPHYCWTHGGSNHSGYDCNHPAHGHRPEATFDFRMGGSNVRCFSTNTYHVPPNMYLPPTQQYQQYFRPPPNHTFGPPPNPYPPGTQIQPIPPPQDASSHENT
mmetsp:Transcript_15151/g.21611  ORF Transcript_15151/g.21611 Transcript_15151/m.21611 type:complete len:154 (-) Transcript_15151:104-565(-)